MEGGRYNNVSEVVRASLRLLQDAEDRWRDFRHMLDAVMEEADRDGAVSLESVRRAAGACRSLAGLSGAPTTRLQIYTIEAGDTNFAPRMKALLLRAVVLARRRKTLAESTRRSYRRRLDSDLNAIMAPANGDGCGNFTVKYPTACSPS